MVVEAQNTLALDILQKQYEDLQALLNCAERESVAVLSSDFEEILKITEQRNKIGERLRSYQKEIDELKSLGFEPMIIDSGAASQNCLLINRILEIDQNSLPMLTTSRNKISRERVRLDKVRKKMAAFSHVTNIPVIYDQHI